MAEHVSGKTGLAMSLAPDSCVDDRPNRASSAPSTPTDGRVPPLPGRMLRERREALGLTLDDVWRTTKINRTMLRALETSDLMHLPAAIYTRGFVKAYAREVGLDPDLTADEYLRRIEPLRSHHLFVDDGQLPAVTARPPDVDANGDAREWLAESQVRRFSRLTLAVAAVGLIVYVASFSDRTPPAPPATVEDADFADQGDAARTGAAGEATADVSTAALTDAPMRVELIPQGPCWLSARVDGERVVNRLLQAGDRETLDISYEVVLRVGEPGALAFSINGESGRPLGRAGQPITVRITKDNFRAFLSS